jgi:hypothetical protein
VVENDDPLPILKHCLSLLSKDPPLIA